MSILERFERITHENVKPGDLVVYSIGGKFYFKEIEEIPKTNIGNLAYSGDSVLVLDNALVLTQDGRVLVGEQLYKSDINNPL